jgi:hypothetical protein
MPLPEDKRLYWSPEIQAKDVPLTIVFGWTGKAERKFNLFLKKISLKRQEFRGDSALCYSSVKMGFRVALSPGRHN